MAITELAPNLSVGAQIAPRDLTTLARMGFTDVVCNRPDAEHPEDPGHADMAAEAGRLGLRFHYLPVAHGETFAAEARQLGELAARPGAKVFAYCRSGARSAKAWALAGELRAGSPSPAP